MLMGSFGKIVLEQIKAIFGGNKKPIAFDYNFAKLNQKILKSAFGISPVIQGTRIIAKIPPLSQEQRGKFVKVINQKAEERKNILRNYRDDVRKKIKQLSEAKEISEDIKFRLEKEIDAETQTLMEQLQKIREAKEKEIMEI